MVRCKKHSFWALDIRPANDNERQTPAKKLILGKGKGEWSGWCKRWYNPRAEDGGGSIGITSRSILMSWPQRFLPGYGRSLQRRPTED